MTQFKADDDIPSFPLPHRQQEAAAVFFAVFLFHQAQIATPISSNVWGKYSSDTDPTDWEKTCRPSAFTLEREWTAISVAREVV